jgi:hypothetical protein
MSLIYCFFMAMSLALSQQPKQPPLKIAIISGNSTVVSGTDVWIKVSETNTSNQDLDDSGRWTEGMTLDPHFQYEVRDDHGKMVPIIKQPHPELGSLFSVRFRTIAPGQTLTQEQELTERYDMRKPGKYTIQVSRRISNNPKDDIKSNIVTVTVTPKDKDPARKNSKVR